MSWRKEMIINHKDTLRGGLLFKEQSKKNKIGTLKQQKAIWCKWKEIKTTQNCVPASLQLHLYPLRCGSAQAKQLKALYHQLPFPSTFGRSLWLLASQLAPMMTLFILQATLPLQPQLFYHNFVWQTICVFLGSARWFSRGDMNCTRSWGQCIRHVMWIHSKLKHGNNSNSLTSVKVTLSSANKTSH